MNNTITLTDSSSSIQHLCKRDKRLAKIIGMIGDISYKPYDDPFKFLVHEIIEQMLSVKAGKRFIQDLKKCATGQLHQKQSTIFPQMKYKQLVLHLPRHSI